MHVANINGKKETIEERPAKPQTIIGSWQLYDQSAESDTKKGTRDKLLREAMSNRDVTNGTMLSFFSDGVFSEVKGTGEYFSGKWKQVNSSSISLADSASTNNILIRLETVGGEPALELLNPLQHLRHKYKKHGEGLKELTEDPFYPENNLWRKRALSSENDSMLQERLGNYFQHLVYILKASKERERGSVLFTFSLGIVKIYSGGIGIEPMNRVPGNWKEGYYSAAEALIAYRMFEKYLHDSHYNGKGSGNWVDDDYRILLNIYGDLKEKKFPGRKDLRPDE